MLYDPKVRPTPEQAKEISRVSKLELQYHQEGYEKVLRFDRENDEQTVAILSPAQRGQLEMDIGKEEYGKPILFGRQFHFLWTVPPGVGTVRCVPLPQKELALTAAQSKKLEALFRSEPSRQMYNLFAIKTAQGQTSAGKSGITAVATGTVSGINLPQLSPELEQKMREPDFQRKVEELKKQLVQGITDTLAAAACHAEEADDARGRRAAGQETRRFWRRSNRANSRRPR